MKTAEIQGEITSIKNLQTNDNKINAAELSQVLTSINNSKGFGDSETFSAAIDFIDPLTFMNHTVSGAIAFTATTTGAKPGSVTVVRLTANGTNVPTFSGTFKKSSTSQNYTNTNGLLNVIYFWHDGTDYWYTIDKQA